MVFCIKKLYLQILIGIVFVCHLGSGQNNRYGSGIYQSTTNGYGNNNVNNIRNNKPPLENKLLYILIDGFRYDYATDQPATTLPGFSRFVTDGVKAESLVPIYPSLSYPSWTTLVTGLWAESHGIVGNYIYDAETNDTFELNDGNTASLEKWWSAEPIWTTATKNGLRTAVHRYSRCDVSFSGVTPEVCEPYEWVQGPQVFRTTMDKALSSLQNGYDFVIAYDGYPNDVGHEQGPETEARHEAVRSTDKTISYMLDRIDQLGMEDKVNIIIVSDHGMMDVSSGKIRRIELDDYLLTHYVEAIVDFGALINIKVTPGNVDRVYTGLRGMPGVQVYKHDQIPDNLHYKNNKFVHDILLKADTNTFIMPSSYSKQIPLKKDNSAENLKGTQGYDSNERRMRGIFYAKGPDFRSNQRLSDVRSVDVYSLLARLLHINPLPNNGSFSNIQSSLINPVPTTRSPNYYNYNNIAPGLTPLNGLFIAGLVAVIFSF